MENFFYDSAVYFSIGAASITGFIFTSMAIARFISTRLMWQERKKYMALVKDMRPYVEKEREKAYQAGYHEADKHREAYARVVDGYKQEIEELKGSVPHAG